MAGLFQQPAKRWVPAHPENTDAAAAKNNRENFGVMVWSEEMFA